jgi:hypothetical protein
MTILATPHSCFLRYEIVGNREIGCERVAFEKERHALVRIEIRSVKLSGSGRVSARTTGTSRHNTSASTSDRANRPDIIASQIQGKSATASHFQQAGLSKACWRKLSFRSCRLKGEARPEQKSDQGKSRF